MPSKNKPVEPPSEPVAPSIPQLTLADLEATLVVLMEQQGASEAAVNFELNRTRLNLRSHGITSQP